MNLNNKITILILCLIIFLGIFLRIWLIGQIPPSLNWDEVSLGYNAFSILQTGRDEHGKIFPLIIESLGDFKPALYVYLIIPFIKLFGLSDFSVRIPALVFGSLTILTTYLIAFELFKRRSIALISGFLIAISPWSIQFSRYASEAMIGLSLNLLMILFFLKGLNKPWLLMLSAFFGGLALYSYQSEKIFLPLLTIILILNYQKSLFKISKKYLISAASLGLLIILPMIYITFTNSDALTRAKDTSFLNKPGGIVNERLSSRLYYDEESNNIVGKVLDNRRIVYGKEILNNYLMHFDLNYLFIKGDINPRHKAPGMGQLYLFELPFLLIGLYYLVFGKFKKESKLLIISWIFITPIAASFTWEVPHAIRTLNFLPTFQVIIAIGIVGFYEFIINKKLNKIINYLIFFTIILLALFNFVYFFNQYFVQYRILNSADWQYGYDQIIPEVNKNYDKFEKIIVSNEKPFDQSYIFFLYNLSYSPEKYQMENKGDRKHNFDKFVFKTITSEDLKPNSKTLLIGKSQNFPNDINFENIKTIYFLNGEEMGKIVEVK